MCFRLVGKGEELVTDGAKGGETYRPMGEKRADGRTEAEEKDTEAEKEEMDGDTPEQDRSTLVVGGAQTPPESPQTRRNGTKLKKSY